MVRVCFTDEDLLTQIGYFQQEALWIRSSRQSVFILGAAQTTEHALRSSVTVISAAPGVGAILVKRLKVFIAPDLFTNEWFVLLLLLDFASESLRHF